MPTSPTPVASAIFHQSPSLHSPSVQLEDKQKGAPAPSGLLRVYGTTQGHQFSVLFDTASSEDLLSPQLACTLQCSLSSIQITPDMQITQKAEKVQFQIQQASFERDFLIAPLTRCDMLLGNPWLEFHTRVLDTKTTTFFITKGVATPTTITCDSRRPGSP